MSNENPAITRARGRLADYVRSGTIPAVPVDCVVVPYGRAAQKDAMVTLRHLTDHSGYSAIFGDNRRNANVQIERFYPSYRSDGGITVKYLNDNGRTVKQVRAAPGDVVTVEGDLTVLVFTAEEAAAMGIPADA